MKRFVLLFAILLGVLGVAPAVTEAGGGGQVFVAVNGRGVAANARRTPVRDLFFGRRRAVPVNGVNAAYFVPYGGVAVNGFGVPVTPNGFHHFRSQAFFFSH